MPCSNEINKVNFPAIVGQLQCLGQQHPMFRSAHLNADACIIEGRVFQGMQGIISLTDGTSILSGWCEDEAQMFKALQNKVDALQPVLMVRVA